MNKRKQIDTASADSPLLVDTKALQGLTGCGRDCATRIGMEAEARVKIGRRVLWNVEKVRAYLNQICS